MVDFSDERIFFLTFFRNSMPSVYLFNPLSFSGLPIFSGRNIFPHLPSIGDHSQSVFYRIYRRMRIVIPSNTDFFYLEAEFSGDRKYLDIKGESIKSLFGKNSPCSFGLKPDPSRPVYCRECWAKKRPARPRNRY
jgi:hypothetical protein